jgi:hypothetical protein
MLRFLHNLLPASNHSLGFDHLSNNHKPTSTSSAHFTFRLKIINPCKYSHTTLPLRIGHPSREAATRPIRHRAGQKFHLINLVLYTRTPCVAAPERARVLLGARALGGAASLRMQRSLMPRIRMAPWAAAHPPGSAIICGGDSERPAPARHAPVAEMLHRAIRVRPSHVEVRVHMTRTCGRPSPHGPLGQALIPADARTPGPARGRPARPGPPRGPPTPPWRRRRRAARRRRWLLRRRLPVPAGSFRRVEQHGVVA